MINIKKIMRNRKMKQDQKKFREEYLKNSILSYPPKWVTIGVTSACNNKCTFCAYHSDDAKNGSSHVYGLPFNISIEDFKRIVNMCYTSRVPSIHICGTGEPFLHKDILKLIDYSASVYGKVSLQTNFYKNIFEKKNYYDEIVKRKEKISYITTDILSGLKEQHNLLKVGSKYEDVFYAMKYIGSASKIEFKIHLILTKQNYESIPLLIEDIYQNKIHGSLEIVNLDPYDFNDFTSFENVYLDKDKKIKKILMKAESMAKERNVKILVPAPYDKPRVKCPHFWTRLQTWPVQGNDKNRYHENVNPGGCLAVVNGDIQSLGYIFDYNNIMELWNNDKMVDLRRQILSNNFPSEKCKLCQHYKV